jgi:hypothetical protein
VEACPEDKDSGDCDQLKFSVIVDEDSVDEDALLAETRGEDIDEQMWVNYHTDRGDLSFDLALVNDAVAGFNDEPFTEYTASDVPGPAQVWAVVRDNRGGSEWARFPICVED